MHLLDLFSGIGGFHLGLEKGGHTIEWSGFCEVDKYASAVYKRRFPDAEELGDVRSVRGKELPNIDIITFGSPCQDFSIAGKRKGMSGARSSLISEAIRLIDECRPGVFIWENVKGTFSSNNRQDFAAILQAFANIGGYRLEWQLLNTRWVLPQNRERIFLVGHTGTRSGREIFPIGEDGELYKKRNARTKSKTKYAGAITTGEGSRRESNFVKVEGLKQVGTVGKDSEASRVYDPKGIARTIKDGGGMGAKTGLYRVHNTQTRNPNRPSLTRKCDCGSGKLYKKCCGVDGGSGHISKDDGTTYCLDTGNTQAVEIKKINIIGNLKGEDGHECHNVHSTDGIAPTVRNNHGKITMVQPTSSIRRLTPKECERLQGFPDDWTSEGIIDGEVVKISDTQRYKQCGNAVTVDIVAMVAERL